MLDDPKDLLQNQRTTSKEDLLVATKTALFKLDDTATGGGTDAPYASEYSASPPVLSSRTAR